jgi:hypothetical protein
MPPGCPIKAKFAVRARVTGNVGIYHMQSCRSYAGLTKPNRWFAPKTMPRPPDFARLTTAAGCGGRTRA